MLVLKDFRCLFPFVPEDKFLDLNESPNLPNYYFRSMIIKPKDAIIVVDWGGCSVLGDIYGVNILGKTLPKKLYEYIPLVPVDISDFRLPSKFVIISADYQEHIRSLTEETLQGIVDYLLTTPFTPVLVGKYERYTLRGALDLTGQTSIPQLASILREAACVVGGDSGVIHLAGTTETPIVSGFTSIDPQFRLVQRPKGVQVVLEPDSCRFCRSYSRIVPPHNEWCEFGDKICREELTSEKFISALKGLGI